MLPEEINYENCGDLDEIIQEWEEKMPDRRTKEYREWKKTMNILYSDYNAFVKFKCYKPLK